MRQEDFCCFNGWCLLKQRDGWVWARVCSCETEGQVEQHLIRPEYEEALDRVCLAKGEKPVRRVNREA